MSDKKTTTERVQDKNSYNLYCVNIYGSGLNSIKDEFKRQVESGLRQTVFILDLDDVQNTLNYQQRNSKLRTEFNKNYASHVMNALFQQIQRFCKEYVLKKKKISDELKFDLNQYWSKDVENIFKLNLGDSVSISEAKKNKVGKKSNEMLPPLTEEVWVQCTMPTTLKEHNRVGQPELLSKRKYIKDDPTMDKLYIIIVGQMTDSFFLDLIRRDQPLRAIVHYVPAESKYDILMGNNKLRSFIMESLEVINASIYELRQEVRMKAVGLFFYELPIISKCLATKYGPEIFNQLSWGTYDIEVLQQQYEKYYYRPYQETDVGIPPTVDIKELFHVAETLSVEGHFQKISLPASAADFATVLFYLESLLNTFGSPEGLLKENEVSLLSMTEYNQSIKSNNAIQDFVHNSRNAFSSITKISKYERIFLAENNKLLFNILQYVDHSVFRNIYLSCLDYNIVRQYVLSAYITDSATTNTNTSKSEDINHIPLPPYVKYYANDECCCQRLFELLNEFEDRQIDEIRPGCKLYSFKRTHNKTIETEGMTVIPTRLCFRDFTLFQMDEFLDNLKKVETQKTQREHIQSIEKKLTNIDIDTTIYVRRNSLKALKMQIQNKFDLPNRKSNSPLIKSSIDKKASLSMSLRRSEQWVGLPPGHHLLNGYNLEDVRQEVKFKTSKYYYENGFVQLYEERWCFQDMNKELIFCINNSTLFLNGLHSQPESLCGNIRLITKNNVCVRILNDSKECSKIVMNYPNGLTVYHQDMLCEQIWCCDQTPNEEQRRICTPYGAIIVFFKANEMILVMRYNGEVYRLYQNELPEEEEEQDLISDFSENLEQSSGTKDMKAQGDTPKMYRNENKHLKNGEKTETEKEKQEEKNKMKPKIVKPKSVDTNSNKSTSDSSVKIKISSLSTTLSDHLKASIKYELDYINFISSTYTLNYVHFIVTTTQGKRLHLTNTGKIFEEKRCDVQEWHDYFANEAYCQRSDNVKMIWTSDTFKCYHKDGSVLTTRTEEVYENADVDEFESLISKSSSHNDLAKRENEEIIIINPTDRELEKHEHSQKPSDLQPITSRYSSYLMDEFVEEHEPEDTRYICYNCSSCLLQHHHYADVNLVWLNLHPSDSPSVVTEIIGIDDIRIYTDTDECLKDGEYNASDLDSFRSGLDLDQKYNTSVVKKEVKLKINVSVGKNLHVTTDKDGCEICAVIQRTIDNEQIIECDSLILRLKYEDCINDVFKYIVNEIATFKNTVEKSEEVLFLEKIDNECKKRGFEFFNNIPLLSKYNYEISNCIIDVKPLMTVNELMTNTFELYDSDMEKFPRFQKFRTKKLQNPEMKFPRVLSTNVYVKIPKLLQNTGDISKFLEPFDNIHFKKFRYKLKDLLDLYLNPKMQLDIQLLYSTKNWRKKHWEHQRRKFTEQQRMGLYHAIIKYKKYPNYWNFLQDYSGQVAYIDFLDFMQHTC